MGINTAKCYGLVLKFIKGATNTISITIMEKIKYWNRTESKRIDFSTQAIFEVVSVTNYSKLLHGSKITVAMGLVNDTSLVIEDNEMIRARFIDLSKAFDLLNDTVG